MDTYEARRQMRALAQEALGSLQDLVDGRSRSLAALNDLRGMEDEARSLLSDAGYPGESVWRALGMARRLVADGHVADEEARTQTVEQLAGAVELLDSLLSTPSARASDFRIIG